MGGTSSFGNRRWALTIGTAAALAAGCGKPEVPRGVEDPGAPADPPPTAVAASTLEPARAARCGECHQQTHDEWASSSHARAATSPTYVAMKRAAGRGDCDRCHAPLSGHAGEGVTCDFCHRITDARPDRAGGAITLGLGDDRRRGALCDARTTYFHRSECSPLHRRSELCGACHLWTMPRAGGELPIVTEYEEWQRGPYAEMGVSCQGCHMPAERREAATGAGVREEVHQHRWLGSLDDLRTRALTVTTVLATSGATSRLAIELTNDGAGHAVPSGLSGRQIVIRVVASDGRGTELARQERVLSRVLVDATGAEAPFYLAERVGSDTRIAPEQTHREWFHLPYTRGGRVTAQVLWRAMSPALAASIGAPEPETRVLYQRAMEMR
jgi:hypothetical protein